MIKILSTTRFPSSILSVHSGWREPQRLLRLRPERPKGPRLRFVRPSSRRGRRQGLPLQLSQHHPTQRLPHSRGRAPAVSRFSPTLPGLPCSGQEARGGLLVTGGFRGADHPGPHYLLHSQEKQDVLLREKQNKG